MSGFTPFRLMIKLKSPIVISAFSPNLDGILYEALSQRYPNYSGTQLFDALKSLIAFNDELGVFHSSNLKFGITGNQGVTIDTYVRADTMARKLDKNLFKPEKSRGKDKNVRLNGGPTVNRFSKRNAYVAPFAVFECLGDAPAIIGLLQHCQVGVGYDAFNVGMGALGEIEIIELSEDVSLAIEGSVNRTLPLSSGFDGEKRSGRLCPPYYSGQMIDVLDTALVRVVPVSRLYTEKF